MAFGENRASGGGWTSVVFDTDRVTIADIVRQADGKPQVHSCEGFAREGSELEILKRLKNAKRLARNRCTTLLAEGQYQFLQIDMPGNAAELPRDELRESLRWRVKEMVDFSVETAGIDLLDIPATGNRNPQLWVVVARHDVLQPRIRQFQDAKVGLAAIDIPELAQRNLAGLFEEANRGLAFLSFDRLGGRLTVTYRGELYMTRHIDVGAAELAGPDADTLHERVLLDIQRSLDNFDRNYSAINLTRLMVGPIPNGEAFVEYLRANLSLPVAGANLADVMDFTQTPELANPAAQAGAWLALGAALRD
jgi:MSHA biogenesis protein MshI